MGSKVLQRVLISLGRTEGSWGDEAPNLHHIEKYLNFQNPGHRLKIQRAIISLLPFLLCFICLEGSWTKTGQDFLLPSICLYSVYNRCDKKGNPEHCAKIEGTHLFSHPHSVVHGKFPFQHRNYSMLMEDDNSRSSNGGGRKIKGKLADSASLLQHKNNWVCLFFLRHFISMLLVIDFWS